LRPRIFLEGPRLAAKDFSHNKGYPGRDSTQTHPKSKSEASLLEPPCLLLSRSCRRNLGTISGEFPGRTATFCSARAPVFVHLCPLVAAAKGNCWSLLKASSYGQTQQSISCRLSLLSSSLAAALVAVAGMGKTRPVAVYVTTRGRPWGFQSC
jgi:hypothetical protein